MAELERVALPDGRGIDVRVTGPAGGLPLVFHHGTPGAGTPLRYLEQAAHDRGLRTVTASRPGYGGSDRHRGRRVVDAAADTAAVLAALGADRCVVGGWSGGGPHALACGARLPAAAAVLVLAGVAPHDAGGLDWMAGMGDDNLVEFSAAGLGEAPLRDHLDQQRQALAGATAPQIVAEWGSLLPEVDRAAMTDEFGDDLAASFREAVRLGVDGWLDDDLAFLQPWGFDLAEVTAPVSLWQGSADLMVPYAHGRWLAGRMPHASAHLLDGEGHLSIGLGALGSALDELVAAAGPWAPAGP